MTEELYYVEDDQFGGAKRVIKSAEILLFREGRTTVNSPPCRPDQLLSWPYPPWGQELLIDWGMHSRMVVCSSQLIGIWEFSFLIINFGEFLSFSPIILLGWCSFGSVVGGLSWVATCSDGGFIKYVKDKTSRFLSTIRAESPIFPVSPAKGPLGDPEWSKQSWSTW